MANLNALFNAARKRGDLPPGYKSVIVSPSQLEMFGGTPESCKRKWWWKSVCKLPEPPRKATAFGTVLHAVLERYLRADESGRDEKGNVVDLYPEDWAVAKNYDGTKEPPLSEGEQALIQNLVNKALEEGILDRRPNREVEAEIFRKLATWEARDGFCLNCGCTEDEHFDDEACMEVCKDCGPNYSTRLKGTTWTCNNCNRDWPFDKKKATYFTEERNLVAFMLGYIDLLLPDEVHDHKTTSNFKYAKGPKRLAKDPTMLLYAQELRLRHQDRGVVPPDRVVLRHNYYSKKIDDPRVKKTETVVSKGDCDRAWLEAQDKAKEMMRLRHATGDDPELWPHVPGADEEENSRACNAFGGCIFLEICTGRESITKYKKRVDRLYRRLKNREVKPEKKETVPVGNFAAKLAALKKSKNNGETEKPKPKSATPKPKSATPKPKSATPKPKPKAKAKPEVEPMEGLTPPWAMEGCKACGGSGINSKGAPCRICDAKRRKAGEPTSADFTIVVEDGVMFWDDGGEGVELTPEASADEDVDTPEEETTQKEVPVFAMPKPDAPAPLPVLQKSKMVSSKELKKKKLVIFRHCMPAKGFKETIQISDLLEHYGALLAAAKDEKSYWLMRLERRDMIRAMAGQIASDLGGANVIVPPHADVDANNLADALQSHAAKVVVGLS